MDDVLVRWWKERVMSVTEIDKLERIKALKKILPEASEEERRCYIGQLKVLLPEPTNTLRIDADGLLYMATFSPKYKSEKPIDGGTFVSTDVYKTTLKNYKIHLQEIIDSVVDACEYESMIGNMTRFKDYELVFTPSTNFRYDIFSEYKYRRALRPKNNLLSRVKRYAKTKLGVVPEGIEADDYVVYYGNKGDPVASGDKDVIKSITGGVYWYHGKHKEVIHNTPEECERWTLLQSVAGDYDDDIPGIQGVSLKTAEKLLPDNATFDDVIQIYLDKGYKKKDAILTMQLVSMTQWSGPRRNKIRLFTW